MADPTIIKGSGTFLTSGGTTLTFYNTQTEAFRKSANLINLPIPASNSSGALIFDLLGVTREITLNGKFTTSDNSSVKNFTSDLNSLVTGKQGNTGGGQKGYQFVPISISGVSGTYMSVFVNDVNWTFTAGEPNTLDWSVSLMEAKTT